MKRLGALFLCIFILISSFSLNTSAIDLEETSPVISFSLEANSDLVASDENIEVCASGLITMYGLSISKSGSTLLISGKTNCISEVVRCGFKNLTVERRRNSSSSWEDFYEFGNVYIDECAANLSTSMNAPSGYQYRVTTKHYAKKSLLVTQTISNESNYLTF